MAEKRKRTRKPRNRVAKENRRNLRLWAEGARESILTPHIAGYADALERGWRAERDYLQMVCNEFHAKIDWQLADHEEPKLPLPEYDPLATVPADDMEVEEETAQRARMLTLNARIQRWLKYRVRKLRRGFQSKLDPLNDPWAIFLGQLCGLKSPRKARQAYQQYMHEAYDNVIAPVVAERWARESGAGSNLQTAKDPNGPFRAKIARELFKALPQAEQEGYAMRAKQEAADAKEKYEAAMRAPPSKAPEDRDKCIASVGTFLGPVMKGIFDRTGLHCCFLLGGPIPQYGGELRTIYASYGRNKMTGGGTHFPEWAGQRFGFVTDLMKEYLGTAFTPQERAEAALPSMDPLAAAKFTLLPANAEGSDPDASDSESDSESDSNRDSDDSEPAPKRNCTGKAKGKAKGKQPARKATPAPASDEDSEPEDAEPEEAREWRLGDPESDIVMTQAERNLYGGTPQARQQAMVARHNALLLAPLKEQWKQVIGPRGKPKSKTAGKRWARVAPAAPRKSGRLNPSGVSTAASDPPPPSSAAAPATANPIPALSSPAGPTTANPAPAPLSPAALATANPVPSPSSSADPTTANPAPPPLSPTAPATATNTVPPPSSPAAPVTSTSIAPADASSLASLALELPEGTPDWLRQPLSYLLQRDLGCHFTALLKALVRLEESAGFDSKGKVLPVSKARPPEVAKWIKGGRGSKMKSLPKVANVAAYAKGWYEWWDQLQPTWRVRGDDGKWVLGGEYGSEWDALDCSGPNGGLSIVAALYFWGTADIHTEESRAMWEAAVQDVTWMLEGVDSQLYE